MNANYGKYKLSRGLMIRILFYGLFLVGPCALTESHSLYIRMKQECSLPREDVVKEETCREWRRTITMLDTIGFSAISVWFAWLSIASARKILQALHRSRSPRTCKSSQTVKGNEKEQLLHDVT